MVVMKWRMNTDAAGKRVLGAVWTPVTVPELPSQKASVHEPRKAALRAS